jgi:hypothetical protein
LGFMSHFKKIAVFSIPFLFILRCNIPRDNILDPQNPDSYQSHRIMIEAFVNTENPYPYNGYMLSALDSLLQLYKNQLFIAEYHRDTEDYQSDYQLVENEILYQTYLESLDASLKGVPDVFIDGVEGRVQGASSVSSALFRLQEAILLRLSHISHFAIEIDYRIENGRLTPLVTIARLGSGDASDLIIKAVLVSKIDNGYHKRVVRRSVEGLDISLLKHGETEKQTLPEIQLNGESDNRLIVYVAGKNDHIIYQSASLQIH